VIATSCARQLSPALILVNPEAGAGRAKKVRASIESYFKSQNFAAEFRAPSNLLAFEKAAREACVHGKRLVVALGGDGTVQALANAALGTSAVLGLLPAGGGNDFATSLGLPNDPVDAAQVLLRGIPRAVDLLQATVAGCRVRCYVGGGGVGLDAKAALLSSGKFRRWPGAARYLAATLWACASFAPLDIDAELELPGGDFQHVHERVLLATVTNTPTYGAGVKIAPAARIDDGLLDFVAVSPLGLTKIVELVPRLLGTGDLRIPELQRYRGRRMRLRSSVPTPFHGDGEILGETPVEIEVLPRSITVIAPRQAPPEGRTDLFV